MAGGWCRPMGANRIWKVSIGVYFTRRTQSARLRTVIRHRPILLALAILLAAAPLLSCLLAPTMTDAEMACCKKMAGNCDMGAGNHSCCKTTINAPQSMAAVVGKSQAQVPDVLVAVSVLVADVKVDFIHEDVPSKSSPIPISPPGLQSILRI
jgi:hypothetical protein